MNLKLAALATFAATSIVLAACSSDPAPSSSSSSSSSGGSSSGGSSSGGSDAGGDAAAGNTVQVSSFKYTPAKLTIKVGQKVTWVWTGGTHTVTESTAEGTCNKKAGGFDSGQHGTPFTFERTFDAPGTYPYFCDYMDHCTNTTKAQMGVVEVLP